MAETTENEYHTDEEEDLVGEEEGGTGIEGEEGGGAGEKRKRPLNKSLGGFSKRGVCYLSRGRGSPAVAKPTFESLTHGSHKAWGPPVSDSKAGYGRDCKVRGSTSLSRVPPHMNPSHVRQIFSKYGEVQRIYLVPEGQGHRKHSNVKAKAYSEGWVEFAKKSVAKRVANLLNGEQIGGKKRSSFYYDIWNIKYLRKFKWDDLVGEIAEKTHIREQKLTLEITAAKKQRDHYLSNAEKSRTQKFIRERIEKCNGSATGTDPCVATGKRFRGDTIPREIKLKWI
ncbi:hypothetical protein VPH35_004579 [Triticum aestivum]